MSRRLYILMLSFSFVLFNSCTLHNTNNIQIDGNNITLLIDRPSVGIVGINEWHWPNLDEALDDLYSQFKHHNPYVTKYDSYNIYVKLRVKVRDKYGNENYQYEDAHFLVKVAGDEIEKYKSVGYMDNSLELSSKIRSVVDKTTKTIHLIF